jgi:hypothetical protein
VGFFGGINKFVFEDIKKKVDDPAMYLSFYGVLWSLGIQYK